MRNCPFTFQCLFSLVALAVTAGSAVPHQDPPADGLAVVLPDRPTIVERSAAKELADGLEKCLLAANALGGTEIRIASGMATLMDGEAAVCSFPTAKRPLEPVWPLDACR